MINQLLRRVSDLMDFINSNWSQIRNYIPGNLEPFDCGYGIGSGVCTEPRLMDEDWISPVGYRKFVMTEQSEEFYCVGIQSRGNSEYLFLMWFKEGRKFWFYDPFVVYGDGFPASVERTSNRLTQALERWEESHHDVLYNGHSDSFLLIGYMW